MNADSLWAGVVGVSNSGRKRGRGKRVGRKKITDLNRGQVLGSGNLRMCILLTKTKTLTVAIVTTSETE